MSAWPSSICRLRKSAPRASMWLAKEWRSTCGESRRRIEAGGKRRLTHDYVESLPGQRPGRIAAGKQEPAGRAVRRSAPPRPPAPRRKAAPGVPCRPCRAPAAAPPGPASAVRGSASSSETRRPVAYSNLERRHGHRPRRPGSAAAAASSVPLPPRAGISAGGAAGAATRASAVGIVRPHPLAHEEQEKLPQAAQPPRRTARRKPAAARLAM